MHRLADMLLGCCVHFIVLAMLPGKLTNKHRRQRRKALWGKVLSESEEHVLTPDMQLKSRTAGT